MDNLTRFNNRIDKFLNRYYKNLIIKGSIVFTIIISILLFLIASLESIYWFTSNIRLVLLAVLVVSALFTVYYFIIIPVLCYFRILNPISNKKIAELLSTHLPELKDYIQNIYELKDKIDFENSDLLNAAITQKIKYTERFDFTKVINFKNVFSVLKFLFAVVVVYLLVYSFKPQIIVNSTKRIINYSNTYSRSFSYSYVLDTNQLYVERGKDCQFSFTVIGDNIPSNVSIFIGNNEYLCNKLSATKYSFTLKNINNDLSFRVGNDEYKSTIFKVKVINIPYLKSLEIVANYPSYINSSEEVFKNIYDLKIPIGTVLKYRLLTSYTDFLNYITVDSLKVKSIENTALIIDTLYRSNIYSIIGNNANGTKVFIDKAKIEVIPDLYPEIDVIEISDKNNETIKYYKGIINDDYGFSRLNFVVNDDIIEVPINNNLNSQEFYFSYAFDNNSSITDYSYYFKIFDNDEVNGFKYAVSNVFHYKIPDFNELTQYKQNKDQEIEQQFEKSLLLANELKKDIENIRDKLFSEKLSDFEKKELINDLNSKQKTLSDMLNELINNNNEKNSRLNSYEQNNEQLKEKQDQIQDLLNNILDDELAKMLKELEQLAEQFNKEELDQQLKNIDFGYDKLEEQLDRNLELLTKYEIERNVENIIEELNKFSKRNLNLADSINNIINLDSLISDENKIIKNLENQYNKNLEKNDDLENPMNLNEFSEEFNELKNNLEKSDSDSKNDKKDKLKENSKQANELANKMNSMLNNNRSDENGENAESLRQILENLIYFSFTQESIIESFMSISQNSPSFIDNSLHQQDLNSLYSIIKDSLIALSKRTPQVGTHINEKVYGIEKNLEDIDILLVDRKVGQARIKQRTVLQNSNDLILLLSESLKNMESSANGGGGKGSKKKNKPKQGEPSLAEMRKSQESIKSQLQNMIDQMKNGQGKPGSEQLAKMLAQQEIFQNMMNQIMQNGKTNSSLLKELNEINNMIEQNKRDLINNNINNSTLYRQNKIVTRLLETEKAEKERDLDDKRESKEAIDQLVSDPSKLFDENKKSSNFNDILFKTNIRLNYFYQNKYQEYIKTLE